VKGSKHAVLKLVESGQFIKEINALIKPEKVSISVYDNWMPKSLHLEKEAELKDFLRYNFSEKLGDDIHNWWLSVKHPKSQTPNWDLVSTCTINGKRGILLVEAKAHWDELDNESHGKKLDGKASANSTLNHAQIGKAITQANTAINKKISGVSVSRDKCYQLSNRVAHAWWLANQGIPVVLLYLGVLDCQDMNDGKRKLFTNDADWQACFTNHAKQVGVDKLLNQPVNCGKGEFVVICRSC